MGCGNWGGWCARRSLGMRPARSPLLWSGAFAAQGCHCRRLQRVLVEIPTQVPFLFQTCSSKERPKPAKSETVRGAAGPAGFFGPVLWRLLDKTLLLHHHTPTWIGIVWYIQVKAQERSISEWVGKRGEILLSRYCYLPYSFEDVEGWTLTVHEAATKFLVSAWAATR